MKKLFSLFVVALISASMWATDGALSGRFTINANGDQVVFSQGNLQYQASTQTWRFAENQYDYIGADNANISDTCTGWIDLFGWGTGDAPTKHSTNFGEYTTFTDWGVNPISNGGNEANQWRTLTIEETSYLFYDSGKMKGQATVNGVHGMVIIPDDWTLPSGLSFTLWPKNWTTNVYSVSEWQQMQDAGAVFLPCAGKRYGSEVFRFDEKVMCWSSSSNEEIGYEIEFDVNSSGIIAEDLFLGLAVRLVQAAPALPVQPAWVQPGDEWDEATKTLTVNSNPIEEAYYNNQEIEHLIISDGVTNIGYSAFQSCEHISSVVIPNSVTGIENYAFYYCEDLLSVVIPGSVDTIGDHAFENCTGLITVTMEEGVTVLGRSSFGYCIALTSLDIPNTVTTIGYDAFHQCYALTSVVIPGSVTTIDDYAFASCEGLTSVTIGEGVASIGKAAFDNCIALTSVVIPNSVTDLGESAFHKCSALTSVTIGNGVTTIRVKTFNECFALTSVEIPNSVEIIENNAFSYCTALASVTIGSSVTEIDYAAFYGCPVLTSVTCLAMTPPTIGFVLFTDCPELAHIYVPAESVDAYKTATNWSAYEAIIEAIPSDEGIDQITNDHTSTTHKVVEYGQILILRGNKTYTLTGQQVK